MPKNKFLYIGLLIVAATALLWLGAQVLTKITYIFPWSFGVGVVLILVGLVTELRKPKVTEAEQPKEGE